ncbi:MAG: SDR family oxidoreductase [Deltaproteobacteria bacterium]|nr:SDR family oxidoreductase [Deltaproteobacteria bacterium]MBW2420890.1 SDR family oxidoreductase [Deltaproteobacteria bacterium]
MELEGFVGRTVVVVGAGGGGIGTGISAAIAETGARVVAVDRDAERLEAAVQATRGVGELTPEHCDASDGEAIGAVIQRAAEGAGVLSGLVNVVGGLPPERWGALLDDDDDNFDALLESNLRIALRSSRAFARVLAASGSEGSLVQIASIAALEAMPFGAGYAAAKAALLSVTRTMALEWGGLGLRVNAVAPGSIRLPRNPASADLEHERRAIPLRRRGSPADVAGAVLFLLSDLSRWITGQVLAVDGGVSVKPSYLDDEGLPVFVRDETLRRRLTGR